MSPERYPADDPREWLNRARSNLAKAQSRHIHDIYLEDLCFDAQQAAEKAVKAVLIQLGSRFPYTHDLAHLLTLVDRAGVVVPDEVKRAAALTEYAVATRYPGPGEPVTLQEYNEAVAMASQVVEWANAVIESAGVPGEE